MKYTVRQIIPIIDECLIQKELFVEKTKDDICFQLAKKLPFEVKEDGDKIIVSLDVHIMTNDELRSIIKKHVDSEWLYGTFKKKKL